MDLLSSARRGAGTVAMLALVGCSQGAGDGIPAVPDVQRLDGAQIAGLVDGGPYTVRIFDGDFAGTVGSTTWDFDTRRVSGDYTTADGETGTFDMPIEIVGDQLCSGEDAYRECYFIYPYQSGFMEVTEAGQVHAVSVPQ